MFKSISSTSDCRHQHYKTAGALKTPLACTLVVTVVASLFLVELQRAEAVLAPANPLKLAINVPKRPTLIAGLNQQFKNRQNTSSSGSSSSLSGALGSRVSIFGTSKAKPQPATGSLPNGASGSSLYLDRHQQQLLAANPNIETANLLTRSDGPASSSSMIDQHNYERQQQFGSTPNGLVQRLLNSASAANYNTNNLSSNQLPQSSGSGSGAASKEQSAAATTATAATSQQQQQQQQSYRGYSLIELEVKSEQDRRYVQDLYGNLSAALNEQAQRPQSFSVSPYVDIDFWSFKSALNDQIDIMVSPKSRAFILGQLSRARIKHRIKIDDIQARMDQQQQQQQSSSSSSGQSIGNPSGGSQVQAPPPPPPPGSVFGNKKNLNELSGRQDQSPFKAHSEADGPSKLYDPLAMTSTSGFVNDSLFFDNYQRLADINQYLESIVARARDIARVQVIGRSSQGRYLRVLRLGYEQQDADGTTGPLQGAHSAPSSLDESADQTAGGASGSHDEQQQRSASGGGGGQLDQPDQPPVLPNASSILDQFFQRQQSVKKVGSLWLDGGTHAREWISPATVLYLAFRLSDNHAKCLRFFDHLRMVVSQGHYKQLLSARTGEPGPNSLDSDLINGINEINTSLLVGGAGGGGNQQQQKPATVRQRSRTELEQKLELLAKRPQEVASEHACDLDLEQLLRKYTFYIMPVLNPDGYEYSHTHNRLWRKTRSTSNHPIYRHFCLGADPNRNYDARHGSTGSSSHPCSQTYGGLTPFTEPETRHQSNFVYAHRNALKMFISFHSYSQMILLPFSHSKHLAPDHKDLESVGQAAVRAIERTHGTQYKVGPSASILYTASGTASDWAYEKAGIKYSYTIELRDTGTFGFLLPRQQIVPTGEETFNGLLAMIAQMELNDNLLTPKSTLNSGGKPFGAGFQGTAANETSSNADAGLVHAPDMDQLRPFGRFRPKPAQLENALDGSDTWATPEPRPPGVRNRVPQQANSDAAYLELDSANRIIEDEVVSVAGEEEPDAGLAFEGEGELMEPTNNLSVNSALSGQSSDAASQSAAKLMGHIYAHSASGENQNHNQYLASGTLLGRQLASSSSGANIRQRMSLSEHQMGLSANGRSLINSPPVRNAPTVPKRESSSDQTQ